MLCRDRLNFTDRRKMVDADIEAIKAASIMAACKAYQHVHCNVEILSVIDPEWIEGMAIHIKPGVVIEVVERNGLMMKSFFADQVKNVVELIRAYGGLIAMDDFVFNDHNIFIMESIHPDIIKVEKAEYIGEIRKFTDAPIVVERIETVHMSRNAKKAGADRLQGYYCDIEVQGQIPERLTPPGVMARRQQMVDGLSQRQPERLVASFT
ncbi:hypothetical protein OX89_04105 [Diaphorobacter sp. J5-51]|nr:hypothetical protein OX89_04105 [Diaphorobacter sp. J5-51]